MELEHSFVVPVSRDRAWDVLLDVERVAPCMPGATLDSVDSEQVRGRIKVKVGPITMIYAGTVRFVEQDAQAGVVTLEASGKETKGAGTASATIRSVLQDRGQETHVTVKTTLRVTGKPAQFGRGVMTEVSGRLLSIFAANLATLLAQEDSAHDAHAEPSESSVNTAQGGSAADGTGTDGTGTQPGADAARAGADADTGPAADLAAPVEELGLSARAVNALRHAGISTLGDLAARTGEEVLAIDGIGPASLQEITSGLSERGLTLGSTAASGGEPAPASGGEPSPAVGPAVGPDGESARPPALKDAAHQVEQDASRLLKVAGKDADATRAVAHQLEDDAINLLQVAGMPVLKRAIPVLVGLAAVAAIAVRSRLRRRRRRT